MRLRALNKRAMLLCLLLVQSLGWATDHEGGRNFPGGTGGFNAPYQLDKPYLVLISIDGFRWDYQDLYETPTLDALAASGVRAERLIPVWPTLTFPNHYTIATGLYPTNHGLVANDFFDPDSRRWFTLKNRKTVEDGSFYGGEPIWVTAEIQGMVAAAYYFVGSEADIQGVHPTHWRSYDKSVHGEERVDQVLAWLADPATTRPHLYTMYFEDVDDQAHWHGPGSRQSVEAIQRADAYLARLMEGLGKLPHGNEVYIIVVSDHGQMAYEQEPPFVLEDHVPLDGMSFIDGGSYVFAWLDPPNPAKARDIVTVVNRQWNTGKAYTPDSAPEDWRLDENPRYPHVILQAEPGYAALSSASRFGKIVTGDHGWTPDTPGMHGIFVASGPGIAAGQKLGAIRSVDIYPLMLEILGLTPPGYIDGDPKVLSGLLRSTTVE